MFQTFLFLRFKQLYRSLHGIGLLRFIFLAAFVVFVFLMVGSLLLQDGNLKYGTGVFLIMIFSLHIYRSDQNFLKTQIREFQNIQFFEYLLLSIPLAVMLIWMQMWILMLVLFTGLYLISRLQMVWKLRSIKLPLSRLAPTAAFEWKAGLRKSSLVMAVAWLGGLAFSFWTGSVPVAIFILGLMPHTFYEKNEPLQMLIAFQKGPSALLLEKFKNHFRMFTIICLPLILLFMVFHPNYWFVPLIELFLFSCFHVYIILFKYAYYEPGKKSRAYEIFSSIGFMGVVFPVFLPVLWMLSIRFYFRAIRNLKFYLDDFDSKPEAVLSE